MDLINNSRFIQSICGGGIHFLATPLRNRVSYRGTQHMRYIDTSPHIAHYCNTSVLVHFILGKHLKSKNQKNIKYVARSISCKHGMRLVYSYKWSPHFMYCDRFLDFDHWKLLTPSKNYKYGELGSKFRPSPQQWSASAFLFLESVSGETILRPLFQFV